MRTSRLSISDGVSLVVFMLISRLFLPNTAEIVNESAGLAWFHYAITSIMALLAAMAMIFLQNRCGGDLLSTAETLLGRGGFYLVGIFYAAVFLINAVLLLRQFSENSFLIGLKASDLTTVTAIYASVSGVAVYFGLEALSRTACILLPLIVVWMFFIFAMLIPHYNIYNLAPWRGNGIETVAYQGLLNAGVNIGVFIIAILSSFFQNLRTKAGSIFWGSVSGGALKILFILVFLLCIGVEGGREKLSPFYEMSSVAYFDRYFERLESFSVFLLIFIGITSIAVSMYIVLYLTSRMFSLPTARPLIPVLSIIIYHLSLLPDNAINALKTDVLAVKTLFGIGIYVIPGILWAAFLMRKKPFFFQEENKGG